MTEETPISYCTAINVGEFVAPQVVFPCTHAECWHKRGKKLKHLLKDDPSLWVYIEDIQDSVTCDMLHYSHELCCVRWLHLDTYQGTLRAKEYRTQSIHTWFGTRNQLRAMQKVEHRLHEIKMLLEPNTRFLL
jgi:hypothetical protein